MGKAIEELAKDRGHEIVSIHDKDSTQEIFLTQMWRSTLVFRLQQWII